MKIAFFCDAYKPTRSGVVVSVVTTAEELRARGHEVTIFAPHFKGYRDSEDDVIRFPAGRWFRARDFSVAWPILPSLSLITEARFRREEFDIVHAHSPFTIGMVGARWAMAQDIPVVFTYHTLYHRYMHYVPLPNWFTRAYIFWWMGKFLRRCHHVIAPSRPVEVLVRKIAPRMPYSVLPTGIRLERFENRNGAAVRARYGIGADEIVLVYVGRMVQEKNLAFLIQAVAPLLKLREGDQAPVRLMMVGGGPYMGALHGLVERLQIRDRVIFTDFIEPAAIPDYLAAGDIFTFASRTETQGVSIAEAMASGLPCVVVGAMGAAQALTDERDGFVVRPRLDEFRAATARLVADPELRAAMGAQARISAQRVSLERSVDDLLLLYTRLRENRLAPALAAAAAAISL